MLLPALCEPPLIVACRPAQLALPDAMAWCLESLAQRASGVQAAIVGDDSGTARLAARDAHAARKRRRNSVLSGRAALDAAPTLQSLCELCGTGADVFVTLAEADAQHAIRLAESAQHSAPGHVEAGRLWLCHASRDIAGQLAAHCAARVVAVTGIRDLRSGPERHVADLARNGVAAVSMPASDWTGGLAALVHRFDLWCGARGIVYEREARSLATMGIDLLAGEFVDRIVAGAAAAGRLPDASAVSSSLRCDGDAGLPDVQHMGSIDHRANVSRCGSSSSASS